MLLDFIIIRCYIKDMNNYKVVSTIAFLICTVASYGPRYEPISCNELNFLPMPKKLTFGK